MATLNLKYYKGPDGYSDRDEDLLLAHYRGETIITNPKDVLYFLMTKERENILAWYPFNKGKVLEIGCGVGCITGILCEKNQTVYSVDQSEKRAQITFERHKSRTNLNVYAGNITDIPFTEKFDYVVLIGVLEYSRRFIDNKQSDHYFLKLIRKMLKPNGVLLLAIENRYGIKYFAGANEDHLNEPFISLIGYEGKNVQTYGKLELEDLLKSCGFNRTNFYYPFPDYKLPSIVFSEQRLPSFAETEQLPIFTYGKPLNFSPQQTLSGILKNGQFGFFSNSFLVEAGFNHSAFSNISYAKFQPTRTDKFQIYSVETANHHFIKFPKSIDAVNHLENYRKIHDKLRNTGISVCQVKRDIAENMWESTRVSGKSVAELVRLAADTHGKEGILFEINRLSEFIKRLSIKIPLTNPIIEELQTVYTGPVDVLRYGLMDFNASNLLYSEKEGYILIDQEWETEKQIPADYALLSSIGYLFTICPQVREYFSLEELTELFGLNLEKRNVLQKIGLYYFEDEIKALHKSPDNFFIQLGNYELIKDSADYQLMEEELSHLSQNYNRVVGEFETLEKQLFELNAHAEHLTAEYNRVVSENRIMLQQLDTLNKGLKKVQD